MAVPLSEVTLDTPVTTTDDTNDISVDNIDNLESEGIDDRIQKVREFRAQSEEAFNATVSIPDERPISPNRQVFKMSDDILRCDTFFQRKYDEFVMLGLFVTAMALIALAMGLGGSPLLGCFATGGDLRKREIELAREREGEGGGRGSVQKR